MSGDAGELHHLQRQNAALPEMDYSRAQMIMGILINQKSDLRHRRLAAEELRILMTHRRCSREFQQEVAKLFVKVLKKSREDQIITEQILWNISNLSCENIPMLHLMLHKGIVKLLAKHATNKIAPQSVRDQAIWGLSNFAGDCVRCRYIVRKTKITEFIFEVLQQPQNLTNRQLSNFSWALRNIFRPISGNVVEIKNKNSFIDMLYGMVTLPHPSPSYDGLIVLQEWISQDTSAPTATLFVNHAPLMSYLLYVLQNEDDYKAVAAIRIIGNIAFSSDCLIQKLMDYGFINEIGVRLHHSGLFLTSEIFWCISNIVGSQNKTFIESITSQENVWETIIQCCYSYDIRLRREALFCAINAVSFLIKEERQQAYREFFGSLIIDTIIGFTNEDSTSLAAPVLAYLTHVVENLKARSRLYEPMIYDMNLKKAVESRFHWCQKMMAAGDLTRQGSECIQDIFHQCLTALRLIEDFKPLPPSPKLNIFKVLPSTPELNNFNILRSPQPIVESPQSILNDPFELD